MQAYEVARELANTRIADYSAEIGEEHTKAVPGMDRIAKLRKASQSVTLELRGLSMTDDGGVSQFVAKYRR